ncbi:MAG: hypothetical protein ACLTQI_03505 [Slackia sp.]
MGHQAAIGYSGTAAMGYAAIEYFRAWRQYGRSCRRGVEARAKAVSAAESTRAGRVAKATVDEVGSQARKAAADKAKEAVKSAPGKALSAARRAAATVASAAERASRAERWRFVATPVVLPRADSFIIARALGRALHKTRNPYDRPLAQNRRAPSSGGPAPSSALLAI